MTDKPIADLVREIEELDQKATPEPWVVDDRGERVACLDANAEWICETHGAYLGLNAALIVALRNAWPRLRDQLREYAEYLGDVVTFGTSAESLDRKLRKVLAERDALKVEVERLRVALAGQMENTLAHQRRADTLVAENEKLREVAEALKLPGFISLCEHGTTMGGGPMAEAVRAALAELEKR